MRRICAQRFRQGTGGGEIGHRLAVEVRDEGEIATVGQHGGTPLDGGRHVGDRGQHQDGGARRTLRPCQPRRQRDVAVGIGDLLERAHSGRKSGTER
jgi:hypothetical protein